MSHAPTASRPARWFNAGFPAAHAQVRLRYEASGVDVEIVDDGAGCNRAERQQWYAGRATSGTDRGGHGLAGIVERATAHGGEAQTGPVSGSGWRVRVWLPFDGD